MLGSKQPLAMAQAASPPKACPWRGWKQCSSNWRGVASIVSPQRRGPDDDNKDSTHTLRPDCVCVSDHLKSSFFELLPEGNHIIRAGGANHPSDHQRTN